MIDFKLYDWQKEGISRALHRREFAFFAECGLGKTCAIIQVIRHTFHKEGRVLRTLYLGPTSIRLNVKREFKLFSKIEPETIVPVVKTGRGRFETLVSATLSESIIVMNYEALLSKANLDMLIDWSPELLICDESHMLKNGSAKRTKACIKLGSLAKYKYIMTGTPVLNNAIDLWSQYMVMDGGKTFGDNYYVFLNTYFRDANVFWKGKKGYFPKWVPNDRMYEQLQTKIDLTSIRATKEACLDLPERICIVRKIELSDEQKKAYASMKKEFMAYIKDKTAVASLAVTKALRLSQICLGHVTADDGSVIRLDNGPRLQALENDLENIIPNGHKVILWCSFREDYKILGSLLDAMKIKHVFLIGGMSANQREEVEHQFRTDKDTQVIVANRSAGGVGINLIEASYSICWSKNFSLAEELQSRDRNYRGGSQMHKSIIKIDYVADGTIEEARETALASKKSISDMILDLREDDV